MKQEVSLETLPQVLQDMQRRAPAYVRLAPIVTAEHLTLIEVQLRGQWRMAGSLSATGAWSTLYAAPEHLKGVGESCAGRTGGRGR